MHEHICSMVHSCKQDEGIEEETQTPAHLCREMQDQLATAEGVFAYLWGWAGVGAEFVQGYFDFGLTSQQNLSSPSRDRCMSFVVEVQGPNPEPLEVNLPFLEP